MSEFTDVKDSGERRVFETGAQRDRSSGKGYYDCLPPYAIHRLARHFENGAEKYDKDNWRKGIPFRCYIDSALRHTFKHLEGHRDEDHLAAAAWNLLCLIESEEAVRRGIMPMSLNDLPDYVTTPENVHPVDAAKRPDRPRVVIQPGRTPGTWGLLDTRYDDYLVKGLSHTLAKEVAADLNGTPGVLISLEANELSRQICRHHPACVALEKGAHD